jgi:hypothetical protein
MKLNSSQSAKRSATRHICSCIFVTFTWPCKSHAIKLQTHRDEDTYAVHEAQVMVTSAQQLTCEEEALAFTPGAKRPAAEECCSLWVTSHATEMCCKVSGCARWLQQQVATQCWGCCARLRHRNPLNLHALLRLCWCVLTLSYGSRPRPGCRAQLCYIGRQVRTRRTIAH